MTVVAAVQLCSRLDPAENLRRAEAGIHDAVRAGAALTVLPELFSCYGDLQVAAELAEPLDGPLVRKLSDWAKECGWLVAGIAERDGDKVYNTALLFDPRGAIVMRYRKRHLFQIDLAEGVHSAEGDIFTAGERSDCVFTPCGVLGLGICFDLRFPEHFRSLSARGAEILIIPSAFTHTTGQAHWQLLLRARAVENLCYVIAANQVGEHSPSMLSYGHSCVIDPWGNVLCDAREAEQQVITTTIDLSQLHELRRRLPVLRLRRE